MIRVSGAFDFRLDGGERLGRVDVDQRRFAGDRVRAVSVFSLDWGGAPLRLQVFDPRDERLALKTSQAGRVLERANIAEVGQMVGKER